MKIIQSFLTKNPCYVAGGKITVKGLMLHSVGCPQPSAQAFVNDWNRPEHDWSCVHAFIDGATGDVYQCLPWNHFGWHGGGISNSTHIGVEMCEPSCLTYKSNSATFTCSNVAEAKVVVQRTYNAAVELFAFLCEQYSLDPMKDGVIISHAEGYKRGVASGHADPEHLWNQLGMGYTMEGFRKAVQAQMKQGGTITPTTSETPVNSGKEVLYCVQTGAFREKANADAMVANLKKAGFDAVITTIEKTVEQSKKSIDEIAREVIQGKWGNGSERKERLTTAGYDYPTVQAKINELMK